VIRVSVHARRNSRSMGVIPSPAWDSFRFYDLSDSSVLTMVRTDCGYPAVWFHGWGEVD
jgi:hypothetical protein